MNLPQLIQIPRTNVRRATPTCLLLASIISVSSVAQNTSTPEQAVAAAASDAMPLSRVIPEVQKALDQYQQSIGKGADALPPLASADFDFKVSSSVNVGGSINLFIFKIGASRQEDVVHDVTYTYALPSPKIGSLANPPTLTDELAKTIKEAAKAVKTA